MIVFSILKIAFDALRANKLRSGLTLLGVIVGVTSVMTIISALEGMTDGIEAQFAKLGATNFVITRMGIVTSEEMFLEKVRRKPFKLNYQQLLEDNCTECEKLTPRTETSDQVRYEGNSKRNIRVVGVEAAHIEMVDLDVAVGRFHSHEDDLYSRPVVFIGQTVRETLFAGLEPLGKQIRIGDTRYTVIGVAASQGQMFGEDQDNFVIIPFSSYVQQYGEPKRRLNFTVKAYSVERLPKAMDEVRLLLRAERRVPYDKNDDFDMLTADNIMDVLNSIFGMMKLTLVGISSISLVVGGIVVMNIMMVSVTERTREIGIRKSLGARQNHILLQFLFESLMLTLGGGLIGVALGIVIASLLIGLIGFSMQPSTLAIVLGVSISTGIGLIFGIYPAMRAARLNPVKALSFE